MTNLFQECETVRHSYIKTDSHREDKKWGKNDVKQEKILQIKAMHYEHLLESKHGEHTFACWIFNTASHHNARFLTAEILPLYSSKNLL